MNSFDVLLDNPVYLDQIVVDVRQASLGRLQVEKDGRATDEGFIVAVDGRGWGEVPGVLP